MLIPYISHADKLALRSIFPVLRLLIDTSAWLDLAMRIECHHRTFLHDTGETQTRLADRALVCSNCHRMIHRTKQWLTVEELQDLVAMRWKLVSDGSFSAVSGSRHD